MIGSFRERVTPVPRFPGVAFFAFLRNLTCDGFYTSKIGIADLQYRQHLPPPVPRLPHFAGILVSNFTPASHSDIGLVELLSGGRGMPTITPERFAKIVEGVLADRLKPPPRLYHYTSQEGLLGILSSKTLWATRIQYLNDSTEFSYTLALLKKAFDLHVVGQLWAKVITHSPLRALDHLRSHPIHVACFSEKQDDLSQWRGYCPGGGGFSVGFDSDQLGKAADSRHAFIAPCVYDPDLQSHLVKQLVDGFIKEGFTERDKDFDAKKVSWDFTMDCIFLACVLKHPSFKDEQEWRIVSQSIPPTDPQLGFRKSRTVLIPHLRFELTEPQVPLNVHLVVGPNPEMELALESATSLFAATNCTGPAVSTSVVPYRQL